MKLDEVELCGVIPLNKLFLNENVQSKICKLVEKSLNYQNVLTYLQFTKAFNLFSVYKRTLRYIESSFTMVLETKNFLELDINQVSKILTSSELVITSEVEVFLAADKWVSHNFEERSKFARDLLLKVRLNLLSNDTLNYLLNQQSSFSKIHECTNILYESLQSRKQQGRLIQANRYCKHDDFILLTFGGVNSISYKLDENIRHLEVNSLKTSKIISYTKNFRSSAKLVCLKGEVYFFGGHDSNKEWSMSVDKYSIHTNTWSKVTDMFDGRFGFSVCAFMHKIYILGGMTALGNERNILSSCFQFDTTNC